MIGVSGYRKTGDDIMLAFIAGYFLGYRYTWGALNQIRADKKHVPSSKETIFCVVSGKSNR